MAGQDTEPKVEDIHVDGQTPKEDVHTHETTKDTAEEEMPALASQAVGEKKFSKAEKKSIKALSKMGMKAMTGITRVTLKRRDGIIFVINIPEVYKSPTSDNSFVCVGELKMDEPRIDNLPQAQPKAPTASAPKPAETHSAAPAEHKATDSKEEEKKAESAAKPDADDDEELDEGALTPMHIDMVMQNANCTRREAVKALIAANNDMVNAIMHLTK